MADRIKKQTLPKAIVSDVKDILGFTKELTKFEAEDGGVINVKPGIKKKGKVLKLELKYDKDFVQDDVHIMVKVGCGEINVMSPKDSDQFSATFCATKSF